MRDFFVPFLVMALIGMALQIYSVGQSSSDFDVVSTGVGGMLHPLPSRCGRAPGSEPPNDTLSTLQRAHVKVPCDRELRRLATGRPPEAVAGPFAL